MPANHVLGRSWHRLAAVQPRRDRVVGRGRAMAGSRFVRDTLGFVAEVTGWKGTLMDRPVAGTATDNSARARR